MDSVLCQFQSHLGESPVGSSASLSIPLDVTIEQLGVLVNSLERNEEPLPYSFFVDSEEITESLKDTLLKQKKSSSEELIQIVYQPQDIFRVRAVTRCSASLSGHTDAVLSVAFSPDGQSLASGSGDCTVRFWDINTQTPLKEGKAHCNWVLCIVWSPDGQKLASGSMDNTIQLWNAKTGTQIGPPIKGHSKWITAISWEPYLANPKCSRFASSSKDGTVKIWNAQNRTCIYTLSSHTDAVSAVRWGGQGIIYTASRDKTIKLWDSESGRLIKTLEGHAHWINSLTLNTDYALRIGPFDYSGQSIDSEEKGKEKSLARWKEAKGVSCEKLVSGSDDFTMFLWSPETAKKPIARLTGHQALVNHVAFSPNGRFIASASFDKSVKLWNGYTGTFIASFRGHVGPVYQLCWSGDSRLLASASKDSTIKCWEIRTKKLLVDLPGHLDEVFAIDWSPLGDKVASGGKDKVLKIWQQ